MLLMSIITLYSLAFRNGTECLRLVTAASSVFVTETTVKEAAPFSSQAKKKKVQKCTHSETSVLKVCSFVVGAETRQQELVLSEERRVFILPVLLDWGFYGNQMYVKEISESFPQNS